MKGPTTYSYKRCRGCDYLYVILGMCDIHASCKHPRFAKCKSKRKTIGSLRRGNDRGVPVPDWCPCE